MNKEEVLIFMHIPKSAGTTMRSIIKQQYSENEVCNLRYIENENSLETIRCFYGHKPFGIHQKLLKSKSYTYITMLRDPIEHVISTYYYILRKPKNSMHNVIKNMSFEEFITNNSEEFRLRTSNRQTRYASGENPPDLGRAKENLAKHFSVVGITEMFDESVFLMMKELGWNNISYERQNVTKNRPLKDQLSKDVLKIIEDNNKLDIELYQYAKGLLQKKIRALDLTSRQELSNLIAKHLPS
ncbi:sulfotransferase family 2 domain-containing protein [Bacillus sp. JJ1533]|uniref:sulfotransferase family 2 domain-containing protein n=1 Tax=Bacillus sp. JJ1533 TaxID=3122959 RepID=UPI0030004BD5